MNLRNHSKFKAVLRMSQISDTIPTDGMHNISDHIFCPFYSRRDILLKHPILSDLSDENILLDNKPFRMARKIQKALLYLFKKRSNKSNKPFSLY